jgi:hypothetical protein
VKEKALADNKHYHNIALHIRILGSDNASPRLPKLLRLYIFWSQQAQLIAALLPHTLLALPTRPNYDLLQVPIVKINRNLYTFYHVLGILRQEFSPALRNTLSTEFAALDTLRIHLDLTANLLLGQYLPRALARTLQEQWSRQTLRTEIPPEGVLELAIQCVCSSLLPGTRFTLRKISHFLLYTIMFCSLLTTRESS